MQGIKHHHNFSTCNTNNIQMLFHVGFWGDGTFPTRRYFAAQFGNATVENDGSDVYGGYDSDAEDCDGDGSEGPGVRLPAMIAKVLREVELEAPLDRVIKSFSGGQQARLLLAAALITELVACCIDSLLHFRRFGW
jgi:hypothetical protein